MNDVLKNVRKHSDIDPRNDDMVNLLSLSISSDENEIAHRVRQDLRRAKGGTIDMMMNLMTIKHIREKTFPNEKF